MAETLIFTKKDLIKWLENNIGSDVVCIASTNNEGVSVNTKKKIRKETFYFASDVIANGRISHKLNGFSILLAKQSDVSPEALECYNAV